MHDASHSDDSLRYLRALGDPDRLHIVQRLRAEPMSVGDVCRALGSPMANVSHHLRLLKEAGIVSASKRGRNVIYRLNHVVAAADAGTHVLDFGCCRVEFVERRKGAATRSANLGNEALLILNRILGQANATKAKRRRGSGNSKRPSSRGDAGGRSRQIRIDNPSFERPATAFFDTAVDGWTKEGDPAGTGVFRNFPDDTPLPGSRMIRNADGEQLATVGARNPGARAGGASALSQALAGATYRAGASYVLSIGVGISSVQPPTGGGRHRPASVRFGLTFVDDAGRRREVVGRDVTAADVIAGQPPGEGQPPGRLVYFSVATTLARSPAPACAGRGIGVLITTAPNTPAHAGHFILDNVTLVADATPQQRPRGKTGKAGNRGNAIKAKRTAR